MTDSQKLLADYVQDGSEAAFRELVTRYVDFIYSAALRLVGGDAHRAQDVTQMVFVDLSRQAKTLSPEVMLGGWLHRHTCFVAAKTMRGERRRLFRERQSVEMNTHTDQSGEIFSRIAPDLDEAINELDEKDREAILLRFFEQHDFGRIGEHLGSTEDAARMRVNRALEKLEALLKRRGVTSTVAALSLMLLAEAVQSAPAGFVATISAAAGTGISASSAITTTKIIAMTTLQKFIVTAIVAAAAGAGVYEARQAAHWRDEYNKLQQSQSEDLQRLQREKDAETQRLAALNGEMAKMKTNGSELLKLREKLTRLSADEDAGMKKWASRVALLKQKLEQMPNRKIPELQFATEKDWAEAAWNADLDTEDGVRQALSKLREQAINTFLNEMMKDAMKKYLAANNDIVPASLSELKSYFDVPVTDDMLANYKLLQTGKVDNSADLVTLTAHADDEYDTTHSMSINGAWGSGYNLVEQAVNSAINNFQMDHPGQVPTDPSQLQPYLTQPVEPAALQKYLDQNAAHPPPPELLAISPALQAYSAANNGQYPNNPAAVLPYITTPQQMAAFEKLEPDAATIAPALDAYSAANNGQMPQNPSDLLPYLTNNAQQTAYQRLTKIGPK
jgi:RNA polymerase sigma factor (sigma-70 family)